MGSKAAPPPPPAPDPWATAAAQTKMNRETAANQQRLNAVNQVTPYGSLTYNQTGTWDDGTPRFEATQSLSPGQQQLYDQYNRNQLQLGQIGGKQLGRVDELLSRPLSLGNEATEARLMELGRKRLDPALAQQEESLRTRLANQGLTMGSEAYTKELDRFGQGRNDAYNQLLLSGRGQAISEQLTERNQPLNEILALMSGSQVQQPQFTTTPQSSIASADAMGMVGSNYASAVAQQQAQLKRETDERNAMMGGIFGLAAAPFGGGFGQGFGKQAGTQLASRLWG